MSLVVFWKNKNCSARIANSLANHALQLAGWCENTKHCLRLNASRRQAKISEIWKVTDVMQCFVILYLINAIVRLTYKTKGKRSILHGDKSLWELWVAILKRVPEMLT